MKFCKYMILIPLLVFTLIFAGCNSESFDHKLTKINAGYDGAYYEVEVIDIKQSFALTDFSFSGNQCLEATINIKNNDSKNNDGKFFKINDFEFYLTIPNITYHTSLRIEENNNIIETTHFTIKNQETKTIYLRINFTEQTTKTQNEIIDKQLYIIKFCGVRI